MKIIKIEKNKKLIILTLILISLNVLSIPTVAIDKEINLNFKGLDLRDAFRALADIADMNIITDSSVEGTVTVNLKGISFKESIELLTKTNGLDYRIIGDTVLVAKADDLKVNFDQSETKIFHLNHANPEEVKETINLVVEDSSIRMDKRTNSLIVTSYPDNFNRIEDIVRKLDGAKQQIVLQVRMEEVSHDKLEDLGIDWSFDSLTIGDKHTSGINKSSLDETNADGGEAEGILNRLTIGDVTLKYMSIINYLEKKGKATVLANPQVATIDGKEASINIGDKVPIVTTDKDGDETVEFKPVGINLNIVPRITGNDEILIDVKPEVSLVTDYIDTTYTKYPVISSRSAETTVRVKDGKTFAIGGLIEKQNIERVSQVPILGDLPIVGILFRNKNVTQENRELVIFITPRIIRNSDDPGVQLEQEVTLKEGKMEEVIVLETEDTEKKTKVDSTVKIEETEEKEKNETRDFPYLVKKGDTFWNIGDSFNISYTKIMEYNGYKAPENLKKETILEIPLPVNRFYVIKDGDTLNKLSEQYGFYIEDVKRINVIESLKNKVGLEIALPVAIK